jgi:nucleoside-diphosphate-sugar epimerase
MTVKERVFVTGGTGFIGSHLVRKLTRLGHEVTVLARPTSSLRFLPEKRVTVTTGDVCSPDGVNRGMTGCSIVFHNAALTTDWGQKRDFYSINIGGTKNVLEAARKQGVKLVVLTSTIGVMGEEDCTVSKREDIPYRPRIPYFLSGLVESGMNHYRVTKTQAERLSIEFCREHGIDLVVIRPAWVYGPREFHAGPYLFCRAVLEGTTLLPGCRHNLFHVVYVGDLVESMVAAMHKRPAGVNVYTVGNEPVPTMDRFWRTFCKYLELPPPRYLPKWLVYPLGLVLEFIYLALKLKSPPLLTRARVYMCYASNVYDITRAKRELGFEGGTTLEAGVAKTVRWWKMNGFL